MSKNSSNSSGGISFFGMLTILFIGLKLTNVINWSWWWVMSPIWIPLIVFGVIAIIVLIIGAISRKRRKKKREERLKRGE